jgi:hypothetical protein
LPRLPDWYVCTSIGLKGGLARVCGASLLIRRALALSLALPRVRVKRKSGLFSIWIER